MKVISKSETGYLCDLSVVELRRLSGDHHLGHQGHGYNPRVKLGTEVEICKVYSQARRLEDHLNDITTAQMMLRSVADRIEPIKPIIEAITKPDEKQEE